MLGEMAARTVLASLTLFIILLQVRAQINCYPTTNCEGDSGTPIRVSSETECCLLDPLQPRSYAPINNSTACQLCIVMNLTTTSPSNDGITSEENLYVELDVVYALPQHMKDGTFYIALDVQTSGLTCDVDDLDEMNEGAIAISRNYTELPIEISCERKVDPIRIPSSIMVQNAEFVEFSGQRMSVTVYQSDGLQEIGFNMSVPPHHENSGNATLTLFANLYSNSSATVNFTILHQDCKTKLNETDYEKDIALPSQKTINSNDFENQRLIKTSISIHIKDDSILERNETFCILLEKADSRSNFGIRTNMAKLLIIDDDNVTITILAPDIIHETTIDYNITVMADKDLGTPLTLDVFTTSESTIPGYAQATADEDYKPFKTTITLMPGPSPSTSIPAKIMNDKYFENDYEKFEIRIVVPEQSLRNRVLVPKNWTSVLILDDETLEIGCKNQTYIGQEGQSFVTIEAEVKNSSSFEIPIHFAVSYTDKTAHEGMDYSIPNILELQHIMPGDNSTEWNITILDDNEPELNEAFTLQLHTEQCRVTISPLCNKIVVTIIDNDLSFNISTKPVDEAAGKVTLVVSPIQGILNRPVTLHYMTADLDVEYKATGHTDYLSKRGTLSFDETNMVQSITITILDDSFVEPDECFQVVLHTTDEAVALSHFLAIVTIIDNDGVVPIILQAPYVIHESIENYTVTVIADRELVFPVTLHVFTTPLPETDFIANISRQFIATDDQDYECFSKTVMLMPGPSPNNSTSAKIMNDHYFEYRYQIFEIHIDVSEDVRDKIAFCPTYQKVFILDDEEVEIGFKSNSYRIQEGQKDNLTFEVEVKNNIPLEREVNFTVKHTLAQPPSECTIQCDIVKLQIMAGKTSIMSSINVTEVKDEFKLKLDTTQAKVDLYDEFSEADVTFVGEDSDV